MLLSASRVRITAAVNRSPFRAIWLYAEWTEKDLRSSSVIHQARFLRVIGRLKQSAKGKTYGQRRNALCH